MLANLFRRNQQQNAPDVPHDDAEILRAEIEELRNLCHARGRDLAEAVDLLLARWSEFEEVAGAHEQAARRLAVLTGSIDAGNAWTASGLPSALLDRVRDFAGREPDWKRRRREADERGRTGDPGVSRETETTRRIGALYDEAYRNPQQRTAFAGVTLGRAAHAD